MSLNRLRAALLLSVSFHPFAALAQESATLDEVTVTATISEVRESRAPAALTVVTGRQIEDGIPGRIGDALSTVPSLFMRGSAFGLNKPGNSVGTMTLRGVPGSSRTLFMIDGVPVNSPYAGTIDYSLLPTIGLDRIEVAPGPFSALYGSNAIGGVINLLTKRPTKREIFMSGSAGGGAGTFGQANVSFAEAYSNGWALAFNFSVTGSSGFADDAAVKSATTSNPGSAIVQPVTGVIQAPTTTGGTTYILGDRGDRPWRTMNGSARFYYDFSDVTKMAFGTFVANSYSGYDDSNSRIRDANGQPVYNGWISFPDRNSVTRRINLNDTSANPFLNFVPAGETSVRNFVRGETVANDIKFTANLSHTYVDAWFISPTRFSTITPTPGGIGFAGPGTYTPGPSHRLIGTVQGEKQITTANLLTVGLQYQRDWFDRDVADLRFNKDPNSRTGAISYRASGNADIYSAFAQNKTDLLSNLSLYLGARYDLWRTAGENSQAPTPVQPTLPVFDVAYPSRSADAFSPKASLVYLPREDITLRASIGRAFKAPDLSQLYSRSQTTLTRWTEAAPDLQPETSTALEVGGEWRPLGGRLKLRATYFDNDSEDLIYTRVVNDNLSLRSNAGRARIRGIENVAQYAINEEWGLVANVTYTSSKMVENIAVPASVGKQLPFTPEWLVNGGVTYQSGPYSALFIGRYVSKVYSDDRNRDTATGYPSFYDPYFTLDAKISYEIKQGLKLSLIGSNLLDKGYYQGFLQPGRTIAGEVAYRF
ncbi:MAG: TonB-dependent receptor [Beijerinckiaceae bacterium]